MAQRTAGREKPSVATLATGHGKDIIKMKWRKGKNAPEPMERGATVVHGNTTYFRPPESTKVYSYHVREEQWSRLPDNPNKNSGLVVIEGLLTTVGGSNDSTRATNSLFSLGVDAQSGEWSEVFPPMPTPRSNMSCVATENVVISAGGYDEEGETLTTVELMDIATKQWALVPGLPDYCVDFSAAVCGGKLYLGGGYTGYAAHLAKSTSLFYCSISELEPIAGSDNMGLGSVWKKLCNLQLFHSTMLSFGGGLLAIGGRDYADKISRSLYKYDFTTDSWTVASQMMEKRSSCFAVATTDDDCQIVIVGGYSPRLLRSDMVCDTVELVQ